MDYIYSELNNNLVDINRIKSITLLTCKEENIPIEGLNIGDYYLEVTVCDSNKVNYCDLSAFNEEFEKIDSNKIAKITLSVDEINGYLYLRAYDDKDTLIFETSVYTYINKIIQTITLDYSNKKLIFTSLDNSQIEADLSGLIDDLNDKIAEETLRATTAENNLSNRITSLETLTADISATKKTLAGLVYYEVE